MSLLETVSISITVFYFLIDYILIFSTISSKHKSVQKSGNIPISVIIAAKNEADNLKTNLPIILNQHHPDFEVILVDDQSTDETQLFLENLMLKQSHLKYLKIDINAKSSKKNALTQGIKAAKNKHLVFTDADCKPLSNNWLETFQNYFTTSSSIVLGYSPYQKNNSPINKLIRFETYQTALNYFGLAHLGFAYMGVGRNLGYTKTIFKQAKGYTSHQHVLSGDDDLLVNQISKEYPVSCCLASDGFVESLPKLTFKSWIEQKRRHYTTASLYKLKHQLLLGFQFVINFFWWFLALPLSLYLCFSGTFLPSIALVSGLILKYLSNKTLFKTFMVKDLWLKSFVLEFQLICLQFYIFSLNLFFSKKEW